MSIDQNYLSFDFAEDQRELARTNELVKSVGAMFSRFVIADQWPYELNDKADAKVGGSEPSQSTNAMILFALCAAAGKLDATCPLVPAISHTYTNPSDEIWKAYERVWKELLKTIEAHVTKLENKHATWSASFGYDDPFTLAWLVELDRSRAFSKPSSALQKSIHTQSYNRSKKVLEELKSLPVDIHGAQRDLLLRWAPSGLSLEAMTALPEKMQERKGYTPLDHAFPVLRYIHLFRAVRSAEPELSDVSSADALSYMERRLHGELSKSQIQDSGFDASELVFAFEGRLFLDAKSVSRSLVTGYLL